MNDDFRLCNCYLENISGAKTNFKSGAEILRPTELRCHLVVPFALGTGAELSGPSELQRLQETNQCDNSRDGDTVHYALKQSVATTVTWDSCQL